MADGIVTYKCDTCNRTVDIQYNRHGIDTAMRCIITDGCLGLLHKVKRRLAPARAKVLADPVEGLQYWYQKKMLYSHQQTIASVQWKIKHGLGVIPVIKLYVTQYDSNNQPQLVESALPDVNHVDKYTTILTFDNPTSGEAQCFTVTSENKNTQVEVPADTSPVLLTNKGELTIAVIENIAAQLFTSNVTFALTARYQATNAFNYTYNVDFMPSVNSPWVSAADQRCVIGGFTYHIYSFNVFNSDIARTAMTAAPMRFTHLNNVAIATKQVMILLASSPFTVYDKDTDHIIDVGTVNATQPQLAYNLGQLYADPSIIKTTYPPIFFR